MKSSALAAMVYMASALFGQSPTQPFPDGRRLALGRYCYTMSTTKDGALTPAGVTLQSITREQVNGVDALLIVVHQHMYNGKFDMRDSLLVHHDDLRPIRLDSERDQKPHVHLEYSDRHISGWKMQGDNKQPVEVDLNGPVWDGNLWGETFAALPLTAGASLSLPIYQYDSGLGSFFVDAVDRHPENTPAGVVQAWRVRAGTKRSEMVEYTVSSQPGLEIGYHAGPYTQSLGGDCNQIR